MGGVVSLWEVQQFYAEIVVKFIAELGALERMAVDENRDTLANPDITRAVCAKIGILQAMAATYSLNASDQQCQRIIQNCQSKMMLISCGEIRDDIRELRRRFEDDFKTTFFLQLTSRQAYLFRNPVKDWEVVVGRFHHVRYNVEESGKCFALERYGAAVFHILQVAEYGVIELGRLMGVLGDKPGWSCLKRLQDLIAVPFPKRSPLAQNHTELLENILPLAVAMKDAWRHKLDHVDNQIRWIDTDFSPQVAEEIISATRGFMRKLAAELPS